MVTASAIEDFVSHNKIAVVGASRDTKKFGHMAYKTLKSKGYSPVPVNSNTDQILGDKCYPDLKSLPEKVDGVVVVVPPEKTEAVVKEAIENGIKRIWLQQGAESDQAIKYCTDHGVEVIHGQCIMMFAKPISFPHSFHRFFVNLFGKLPK